MPEPLDLSLSTSSQLSAATNTVTSFSSPVNVSVSPAGTSALVGECMLSAPQSSVPSRVGPGGRKAGAKTWDAQMMCCLLDEVEAVLPRGHYEWEKVVRNYNARTSEGADYDRLRNKFLNLYRAKKPTGKHTMPAHIVRAKRIADAIEQRVSGGVADGENDHDADAIDVAASESLEEGQVETASLHSVDSCSSLSSLSSSSSSSSSSFSSLASAKTPSTAAASASSSAFPSDRTAGRKRQKISSDIGAAADSLSASLSGVMLAQMRMQEEYVKLAREQFQEEVRLVREQMAIDRERANQQFAALLAAVTGKK